MRAGGAQPTSGGTWLRPPHWLLTDPRRWGTSRARAGPAADLRGAAPAPARGGGRRPGARLRRRHAAEPAPDPAGVRHRRRDRGPGCLWRWLDQLGELVVIGVLVVLRDGHRGR